MKIYNKNGVVCIRTVFAAFVLFLSSVAGAVEISAQQAAKAALNWVRRSPRPLETEIGLTVRETRTHSDAAGAPLFHIVRFEEGGFVITSADDGILPIIAFSAGDDLITDERNPFWVLLNRDLPQRLAVVRAQVAQPQLLAILPDVGTHEAEWQSLLSDSIYLPLGLSSVSDVRISPLIQSKWSQSDVNGYNTYNYYTPNNYVCGCVATAGAQIMRMHQYPTTSVTAGAYTCFVNGTPTSLTMLGGTYSWSDMPLVPSPSITLTQRQAIGKLTYDVGVASYMQYASGGSAAHTFNLAAAFTGRFGYASARLILDENNGVDSYLQETALANLDAGFPVAFGIFSPAGGHEVVGDGYGYSGSTLYVHLNMGWSGTDDAWYNLPTVDSSPSYSALNSILYNIFPTHTGEVISGRVLDSSGNPVSGASVVAVNETTSATLPTVTSSAKGIYAVLVPSPPSSSTHSYRLTATSGSMTGTQTTTVTPSVSTTTSYNESTGGGSYSPGTGSVGNRWGMDLTISLTIPDVPTNVNAQDGGSIASVTIAWTASSGATKYHVYRHTSNNSASASLLGSPSGTTYTDIGATPGVLYFYWVKASNSAGTSDFSSPDTGYRALAAPTGVNASDDSPSAVTVMWNSVPGAFYYRVYRAESSNDTKTALGSWQVTLIYNDVSAATGTTYYYWVMAAVDSSGTRPSDYSTYDTGVKIVAETTTGVPFAWLDTFGLVTGDDYETAALKDQDGDGYITWQEYVMDTNPANAASYLRVMTISNGPPPKVYFTPASTARNYTLLSTTNLTTDAWEAVPGQGPRPGAGGADTMQDNRDIAPTRFYRIKVEVP